MTWPLVSLGSCCEVVSGATPKTNVDEYWNGDILWATPKDISTLRSPWLLDTPDKITTAGYESCSTQLLPVGAVLVSSRAPIGNVAIVGKPLCTNQGFKSLIPGPLVDSGYLYHCMKQRAGRLNALGNGATFKEVSKSVVEDFDIPLPPLKEQKRIAAILDKADSLRRKRQQAIQLADDFLRAAFLDMFGDPVTNPKGWVMQPLSKLCSRIQIGPFGTQLHQDDYVEGGMPLVNPTHIVDGIICPNRSLTVSQEKHEELLEYHLDVGDVILGRRGEMGRCALVTACEAGYLCGTGSLFLRPDTSQIHPVFLSRVLSSSSAKSAFERAAQGATMPNLNKTIVGNFQIGVPPLPLQEAFAKVTITCERITKSNREAMDQIENCRKSIQHQAFG